MTFWDFILKVWVQVTTAYLLAFVLSGYVFTQSELQTTGRFLAGFSFFFPASLLLIHLLIMLKPAMIQLVKLIRRSR